MRGEERIQSKEREESKQNKLQRSLLSVKDSAVCIYGVISLIVLSQWDSCVCFEQKHGISLTLLAMCEGQI